MINGKHCSTLGPQTDLALMDGVRRGRKFLRRLTCLSRREVPMIYQLPSAVGPTSMFKERRVFLLSRNMMRVMVVCLALGGLTPAAMGFGILGKKSADNDTSVTVELQGSEADVIQAVRQICDDQIIHGTYVYEKDRILRGAHATDASTAFGTWEGGGKVFYKVAENVLAPRNFVDSNDMGTITVRYVVLSTSPTTTSLRVEAIFIETARRRSDRSQGMVEAAETEAVKQRLENNLAQRRQEQEDAEKVQRLQEERESERRAVSSMKDLEQQVAELRQKVEARTKEAGVSLRSAPFRSASSLESLPAKSEVVLLILTQYWYGVETASGHRGWIRRSELEPVP